jgi:hypothetical protein
MSQLVFHRMLTGRDVLSANRYMISECSVHAEFTGNGVSAHYSEDSGSHASVQ